MNTKKKAALAITVMILAILGLAGFGLAQRQSLHQVVTFEAFFDTEQTPPGDPGPKAEDDPSWYGQVTLTIDGRAYEGTAVWCAVKGQVLENAWYGCAKATYDFGDLGTMEIWERAKTTFDDVTESHRKHGYSGIDMVADGTAAFEKAIGMFYLLGHTEWWIDADGSRRGEAVYSGCGTIEGIMLPQE
ncbi:MAG: hypothetical protein JSW27_10480 [Phycisphaerales bacterium]|nr:MAG: hypothetical protein JSW27_10480 [Phycisphaerales bacterium]